MFGKYTSRYKSAFHYDSEDSSNGPVYSDSYFYNTVYDNYGGRYESYWDEEADTTEHTWSMDGFYDYEGSSTYNEETGVFTGYYTYDSEITNKWNESTYYSRSSGSSSYEQDRFEMTGTNEYETLNDPYWEDDYYYKSQILSPLVYDYTCYQSYYETMDDEDAAASSYYAWFTYVSGIEAIDFREGEMEGSFVIDYGSGACDNLVTITENGETYEVDLWEFYQYDYTAEEGD
mgnify:CR=1 FL=1